VVTHDHFVVVTMDVGLTLVPQPRRAAQNARMVEALGFASLILPDSQNLAPEVWGQLMLAAEATSRIRLGPGVTNSVTRDPAVTASAALALQVESGGRAVLGIGRGDSSVQRIGKTQDPVARFERYLTTVQAYLRGDAVERNGFQSRLEWLPEMKVSKVPVEVAATGRRVIETAARCADRICFAVGADPTHLGAALAHARTSAQAAGRDPKTLQYGAFVNCVVHDDVGVARDALRGSVATFARFSALQGSDPDRLPRPLRDAVLYIREHYDMRDHTRTGVAHTAGIADDFVDWFAIAGPPDVAVHRLQQLANLGLDFVHIIPGSTGMPREVAIGSVTQLGRDVLPALAS
jgi:5,10-methylenetetrahydromethanopterin reductase